MATFVIVHGVHDGGWAWREVARKLQVIGHTIFTPTLTGSGERVHLASPTIGLNTHIMDIVNVLRYEQLSEVILVGASYGGAIIMGVAERAPEKLAQLIFLDAFVLEDGEAIVDLYGPEMKALATELIHKEDGWHLPIDHPVDERNTDLLVRPALQPLRIENPTAARLKHTYVLCTAKPPGDSNIPIMAKCAERAKARGWHYRELATEHYPALTNPEMVADLLIELL